jgi:hypothetical protein
MSLKDVFLITHGVVNHDGEFPEIVDKTIGFPYINIFLIQSDVGLCPDFSAGVFRNREELDELLVAAALIFVFKNILPPVKKDGKHIFIKTIYTASVTTVCHCIRNIFITSEQRCITDR